MTIYVDIPSKEMIGQDDGAWINLRTFDDQKQAVEWVRENIGDCTDDGEISLLSGDVDRLPSKVLLLGMLSNVHAITKELFTCSQHLLPSDVQSALFDDLERLGKVLDKFYCTELTDED